MGIGFAPTKDSGKAPSKAPLLESGGYPARLCRLIDLGKQPGSVKYPEPVYKLLATFELLDEYMAETDDNGNVIRIQDPDGEPGEMIDKILEDKPRWFDFEFTYNPDGYMGDRSHIFKFMTAIDAFEVKPDPANDIAGHPAREMHELLGSCVIVNLAQYTKTGGKNAGQLANKITAFTAMKSKDKKTARELINPTVFFDLGNPDLEAFGKLPGGDSEYAIKNRVLNNLDFNGSKLQALLGQAPKEEPKDNKASQEEIDENMKAELEAQQRAREEASAGNGTGGAVPF